MRPGDRETHRVLLPITNPYRRRIDGELEQFIVGGHVQHPVGGIAPQAVDIVDACRCASRASRNRTQAGEDHHADDCPI